ncbi:MAG TPA: hypothetical protein VJS91_06395 [Nitrososphaeraceae archaeon]|nr:hypothetical protein [Nitrososphaeraceae archaeon]
MSKEIMFRLLRIDRNGGLHLITNVHTKTDDELYPPIPMMYLIILPRLRHIRIFEQFTRNK